MVNISIVIPVLNEANHLANTLRSIQVPEMIEVIVVDGGSQDDTVKIATTLAAYVIQGTPGRAAQMNQGARVASGDILLFLHGDTILPEGFERLIRQTLAQPDVVAGAFELRIDGTQWGLRLVEWGVNWRSRWLQMPYGDQAIFLKASIFHELGGFPELPIMEDFEFLRQLRRLGKIAIAPASVCTSGRRWQRLGILKTTLVNQLVILAYLLRLSPEVIARWYRRG